MMKTILSEIGRARKQVNFTVSDVALLFLFSDQAHRPSKSGAPASETHGAASDGGEVDDGRRWRSAHIDTGLFAKGHFCDTLLWGHRGVP